MKSQKLVSIIIPVYNVENYIKECVESCLNQSYSNIEVIAVDDGSKDNSGKILDELAIQNKKLKVIHKTNSGVSAARNDGIDNSMGEYITFVDADDYLSPDAVEYMMNILNETASDFVILRNCFTSSYQKQFDDCIKKINNEHAIALLLGLSMELGCWNKLYSKKMLLENKIRFNENLFYGEGLRFILNVAEKASSIGLGTKAVYYYRKSNLSSATSKFNYKKFINGEKSLLEVKNNLSLHSEKIEAIWKFHYAMFAQNVLVACINNKKNISDYNKIYDEWKKKFDLYYTDLINSKYISKKDKLKLKLIHFSPNLFAKIRNRKIKKMVKRSV